MCSLRVQDVIEQYTIGHLDLLARIKQMHSRLDLILGKQSSSAGIALLPGLGPSAPGPGPSVASDAYESRISLASRIVKVERKVRAEPIGRRSADADVHCQCMSTVCARVGRRD